MMKRLHLIILSLYSIIFSQNTTIKGENNEETPVSDTVKIVTSLPTGVIQSDNIKKYSQLLKKLYIEVEPTELAEKWYLPFNLLNRSNLNNISYISEYGEYRSTRVKGHQHSGIDIVPAARKNSLDVYAVSRGVVCFINHEAPVKTVIIKHKLKNGSVIYSAFIHLKEIFTEQGKQVDESTKIGVLYTKSEALKYGGNFDHLHFEIKKRMDDYSCASWLCMSRLELDEYFLNPAEFFKDHLNF